MHKGWPTVHSGALLTRVERIQTGCRISGLLFGTRHRELDFLYRIELEGYLRDGLLTQLITAFSRDPQEKIYVHRRMLEYGAE